MLRFHPSSVTREEPRLPLRGSQALSRCSRVTIRLNVIRRHYEEKEKFIWEKEQRLFWFGKMQRMWKDLKRK
jgi:hypothetical protein